MRHGRTAIDRSTVRPKILPQYIERETGRLCSETLCSDRFIRFLYAEPVREHAAWLLRLLTSYRLSTQLLALLSFDLPYGAQRFGIVRFLRSRGIKLHECVDPDISTKTARAIFERQIRYWEYRPMPQTPGVVVSPADAYLLLGSLQRQASFFIKGKFFVYAELLGSARQRWLQAFAEGDVVICRLTPEKYHYTHCPVSGMVRDIYELPGDYHSCHPAATVALVTPLSKNRRVVTIIDSDVPHGSGVGLVAMIEVVALMVGHVTQCYSAVQYAHPQPIVPGMFVQIGQPKSLFRPGSSTVVVLLQPGRVQFAQDLLRNQACPVLRVYAQGFQAPLMETEVQVRSYIATQSRHKR